MDDMPGTSYMPSDPGSWVRAALYEIEDSPVPATAIRERGRIVRIRRRVAISAVLTGTVAAVAALAVSLTGIVGGRHHGAPLHHGHARPPERLQPAGAPMLAAQGVVESCAGLSPDGRMMVTGDDNGSAYAFRLADRRLVTALPPATAGDGVSSVAYAPNGRYVAVGRMSGQVSLWSTVTHRVHERLHFADPPEQRYQVAFSPAGGILAAATGTGQLVLWHLPAPSPPVVLTPPGQPRHSQLRSLAIPGLAFSPDGRHVAVFNRGALDIWSITGDGARLVRQITAAGGYSLQYSPDGSMIAVGTYRGTMLVDAALGRRTAFLHDPAGYVVSALAFSPDGSTLAAADGNSIFLWNMGRRAITAILKHPADDGGEVWVSFTPDQHSLVALTHNNYSRVWTLDQRQPSSATQDHDVRLEHQ
jgi:WD40 repeat protein